MRDLTLHMHKRWGGDAGPCARPTPCPLLPGRLTLISAGVILRLVGRCLTVAALSPRPAMPGLSAGLGSRQDLRPASLHSQRGAAPQPHGP